MMSESINRSPGYFTDTPAAVLADSATLKWSVARAGLVAAIRRDDIPTSSRWPLAICPSGPDPLESLAVALSRAVNVGQGAPALAKLIAEFQKNEKTLELIARQSLPENAPNIRLVVVVDNSRKSSRSVARRNSARRSSVTFFTRQKPPRGGRW